MTGATICISTFTEQIVTNNTALVRPFLAKTWYFTDTFIMACCAIAYFLGLMRFVVEFHAML